jgi:signal transduction histidine kinase
MKPVLGDLLVVACLTIATFVVAAQFELHEGFSAWTLKYERWELDELPTALLALAAGLSWFALRRWRDARAEIAQRLRAERRIAELAERNRHLTHQLINAQESERRALARELHDELGQTCNAIHVEAAYIANLSDHQRAAAADSAQRIATAVQSLYQLMRDMLRRLRPAALDELGLVPALQELCATWTNRTGIACHFRAQDFPSAVDDATAVALYRIAQEALANVARHSGASSVEIRLRRVTEGDPIAPKERLILTIDDNGRGMDDNESRSGLGLLGMQERVAALGGVFAMESAPGRGLHLQMAIPAS